MKREELSSESLRLQLISYYENQFPSLLNSYLNDRAFVMEEVSPYFHSNFRAVDRSTWTPLDYEELRADRISGTSARPSSAG